MTYQSTTASSEGATCGDVLSWAKGVGEKRDAIYELEKVPARMGMADDDIGLIPADLTHFHHVIAKTPYGMVSNAICSSSEEGQIASSTCGIGSSLVPTG